MAYACRSTELLVACSKCGAVEAAKPGSREFAQARALALEDATILTRVCGGCQAAHKQNAARSPREVERAALYAAVGVAL